MFESGYIVSINSEGIEYYTDLKSVLEGKSGSRVEIYACNEEFLECDLFKVDVNEQGKIGVMVGENFKTYLDYTNNKLLSGPIHVVNIVKLVGYVFGILFSEAKESGDYSVLSNTVSGPIGIYFATKFYVDQGLVIFLGFLADLSVSLAVINLLPIPALDGGRVLILTVESILRKDLDSRIESLIINISFVILMILVVLVMFKDIFNIEQLRSIFG